MSSYSNHVSTGQGLFELLTSARSEAKRSAPRPVVTRPAPRTKRLTSDETADLCRRYVAGRAAFELARDFGIHPTTVTATLKREGVEIRQRGLTDEQIDEAEKLYRDGQSLARIGQHFRVDHGTVWCQLKKRGVKMRDTHGRDT
ncbi:hypothetical protein ACXPWS_05315 [Mycobacterium sp. BMJ-28]